MKYINFSRKQWKVLAYILLALRTLFPPLILFWPFTISIYCAVLDGMDYSAISNSKLLSHYKYEIVDKVLDTYYLIFLLVVSIWWGSSLLVVLFAWRVLGLVVISITKKRELIVLFSNTFEHVFWLEGLSRISQPFQGLYHNYYYVFIFIAISFSVFVEFYVHYYKLDSSLFREFVKKKYK